MTFYLYALCAGGKPKCQRGFTLIELVVVMGIISLIAAMAYPIYTRHLQASLRTDAHAGLMQAAAELERCNSRTYTYHECDIPSQSPGKRYTLTLSKEAEDGYLLSASTLQDDGCETAITLNSRGERFPKDCW
ncbi:type IV pilin protein [Vreelandella zhanjiangensis]|uniref:type IV pilin protein n=1 Tax=Vreelandella zhanjiangensis TaxID=1121960 RepID=UPI0003713821|nr:type IV pilin protein [Halomonas zhanjiangensis]